MINECFTENMNIARVLHRLAYSFKRHVYVMDHYFVHVGMMKVPFYKGERDGSVFKVGILIEVLIHIHQWPWFGGLHASVKCQWPANPNSDWIHHTIFLTLNFIIDFVTYEVNI